MPNFSSWIEVDLNQFKKNIAIIKKDLKDTFFCLVIKANAYGHGLLKIAKIAEELKIDYLAVSNLNEAEKIRKANIKMPILVLGSFYEEQIEDLINYDLEISVSSFFHAALLKNYCCKFNKTCKVHLKIDTGLKRLGIGPEKAINLYNYLKKEKSFNFKGIFSHFACGDIKNHPMNEIQLKIFNDFLKKANPNKSIICHIANTPTFCNVKNSLKDMVRLGALAFGCYKGLYPARYEQIKSIFSLKSRIVFIKEVKKGEGISYNHLSIVEKDTKIAILPLGYADGYSRSFFNKAKVLIKNKFYPIVGSISMNQMAVDIKNDNINIGDEVMLIGRQKEKEITLKELADFGNTITYEILSSFNERFPIIYKE